MNTNKTQSDTNTAAQRLSGKERLTNVAEAVRELATLTDGCERRVIDLLGAVTELSVLLECPEETPRADGGRPIRYVRARWDDAVEWITAAQLTAKACADDVLLLLPEIRYCAQCVDEVSGDDRPTDTPTEADEYRRKYEAGFNDITKFMWGAQQTSEDNVVKTGIINWISWVSNQTTFGYTGYGEANLPFFCIDKRMYERIGDTDFRKLEFKAPEGSPLADKVIQIPEGKEMADQYMPAYAAVKFRPNQGNISDNTTACVTAYPIMRVEEMYFIEAEAAAHQSATRGLELLTSFMKTYRDPQYSTRKTSTDEVVEEVVFQKRVELWGEGQTFFDIKRLNYSVTRGYPGTNWYDAVRLNTLV